MSYTSGSAIEEADIVSVSFVGADQLGVSWGGVLLSRLL